MKFPHWVNNPELDEETIKCNKLKFLVMYAAIYHNENGYISELAVAAGSSRQTIWAAVNTGAMTSGLACAIESAVGKEIVPKHLLCPEKFSE